MLIPQFRLSQEQNFIILTIRLPYAKISACEFYIQQTNFKFYLKPYILTLTFQQKLKTSQEPDKAIYDVDKHLLRVHLLKDIPGEHFQNLDMITKLMNKGKKQNEQKKVGIQIIGESTSQIVEQKGDVNPFSYGFNNNYTNVFTNLLQQTIELFSSNPEITSVSQRLLVSRQETQGDFQLQHYLYDMKENQQIDSILNCLPTTELSDLSLEPMPHESFIQLLKLPKKDLLISQKLIIPTLYQIFDLMFCYFYESRCMGGQFSVQSAVTINQTSSVLSNNINYEQSTGKQVIIECFRRCLTYSLYSHWELCQQVLKQVVMKFRKDKILEVLVNLKRMFTVSQPRHYLNRIYIDDFCVFVQKVQEEYVEKARIQIESSKIMKEDLGLGIQQSP